jgi:cellulose 1,4-beta-cellobiosidase
MMKDDSTYEIFKLGAGMEFTFDVDVSNLPCGLKKYSTNKAGAKYGTGYCDAQCPRDLKFINGEVCSSIPAVGMHQLTTSIG